MKTLGTNINNELKQTQAHTLTHTHTNAYINLNNSTKSNVSRKISYIFFLIFNLYNSCFPFEF